MSLKMVAIPVLAAGAALAMFKLVSLRRAPGPLLSHTGRPGVTAPRGSKDIGVAERDRLTAAAGVLPESVRSTPSVLPIAFWDAASEELDVEETPPTARVAVPSDTYDALDPEDLGLEWLSRATEAAFDVRRGAGDDPAEIPVDSTSMISDASRLAARPLDEPASERLDD
jgi:hypothetical protein